MEITELFRPRGLPWMPHPPIADMVEYGDCWERKGARTHEGYGVLSRPGDGNRQVKAHRLFYETLVEPIGDLTIDHLCRNRACVNPDHMEPVASGANVMRGYSFSAMNARKQLCPKGHSYEWYNNQRWCRTCHNKRSLERYYALRVR